MLLISLFLLPSLSACVSASTGNASVDDIDIALVRRYDRDVSPSRKRETENVQREMLDEETGSLLLFSLARFLLLSFSHALALCSLLLSGMNVTTLLKCKSRELKEAPLSFLRSAQLNLSLP
jgi:hypothetical protein